MLIAIMSDSHDNILNLEKALKIIVSKKAEMIIHCGDFVAPFILKDLDQLNIPVHCVFGNNDGDQYTLTKLSINNLNNITIHGIIGKLNINDCNIGFVHQDDIAMYLALSSKFDIVCFGHTHVYLKESINKTILLNPGEIMGKEGKPSFCMLDSLTKNIKKISI